MLFGRFGVDGRARERVTLRGMSGGWSGWEGFGRSIGWAARWLELWFVLSLI